MSNRSERREWLCSYVCEQTQARVLSGVPGCRNDTIPGSRLKIRSVDHSLCRSREHGGLLRRSRSYSSCKAGIRLMTNSLRYLVRSYCSLLAVGLLLFWSNAAVLAQQFGPGTSFFEKGWEALSEGKAELALDLIGEGLRLEPESAEGRLDYGRALLALRRFEEAVRELEVVYPVVATGPRGVEAFLALRSAREGLQEQARQAEAGARAEMQRQREEAQRKEDFAAQVAQESARRQELLRAAAAAEAARRARLTSYRRELQSGLSKVPSVWCLKLPDPSEYGRKDSVIVVRIGVTTENATIFGLDDYDAPSPARVNAMIAGRDLVNLSAPSQPRHSAWTIFFQSRHFPGPQEVGAMSGGVLAGHTHFGVTRQPWEPGSIPDKGWVRSVQARIWHPIDGGRRLAMLPSAFLLNVTLSEAGVTRVDLTRLNQAFRRVPAVNPYGGDEVYESARVHCQ